LKMSIGLVKITKVNKILIAQNKQYKKQLEMWKKENPTFLSEKKNIPIDKRSADFYLFFPDYEKTTYNKAEYSFKGETLTQYSLNLPNNIIGKAQPMKQSNYILGVVKSPGYYSTPEGFVTVSSLDKLSKELEQKPGKYKLCQGCDIEYEILTNANGVKMKRSYQTLYDTHLLSYEFVNRNIYYIFTIPKKIYDISDDVVINKNTYLSDKDTKMFADELKQLKPFIDQIKPSPY
jgi:hypothetical protein